MPLLRKTRPILWKHCAHWAQRLFSLRAVFLFPGPREKFQNTGKEIFLGNNGTALRFLIALVTLGSGKYILTGGKRLCERPVGALVEALKSMNVDISCLNNCPPVTVKAAGLTGGKIILKDIESSQYVSALLLCAPYTKKGIDLSLQGGIVSAPYIDLTVDVMRDFGAQISCNRTT